MTPDEAKALHAVASELERRASDMRDQYRRSLARGWHSTWSESCLIQSTKLSAWGAFCHALADKYEIRGPHGDTPPPESESASTSAAAPALDSEPYTTIAVEPGAVYTGPPGPRVADLPPASEVFLDDGKSPPRFVESEPASGSEPASPSGPQSVVNTAGRFGATVSGYKR